jgi:hypothetical protein
MFTRQTIHSTSKALQFLRPCASVAIRKRKCISAQGVDNSPGDYDPSPEGLKSKTTLVCKLLRIHSIFHSRVPTFQENCGLEEQSLNKDVKGI